MVPMRLRLCVFVSVLCALLVFAPASQAQTSKPNIVVIFGDDIGYWNVSACNHGMTGWTPNIDSIAKILFTDHYGQPSSTAGRAAFIIGQLPNPHGMTTVGIPGSTRGIQKSDPTLAEALKSRGYATAQLGKNHLGDRNEFLADCSWLRRMVRQSLSPERGRRGPRSSTTLVREIPPTSRNSVRAVSFTPGPPTLTTRRPIPKFGLIGRQKIEDTGPLTRKRMETVDAEVLAETLKWMDKNGKDGKPFLMWSIPLRFTFGLTQS